MERILKAVTLWLGLAAGVAGSAETPFHDLRVTLDPDRASLSAEDRITLPAPVTKLQFALHGELRIDSVDGDLRLEQGEIDPYDRRIYQIQGDQPFREVGLRYGGQLSHGVTTLSEGYAGGRYASRGYVAPEGVFLSGGSGWYPDLDGARVTFRLKVDLPEGWSAISQGDSIIANTWKELIPQEEIYLVAGPFTLYEERAGEIRNQAWLRNPDKALADRYLQAAREYLQLYEELIGDYPYAKFALVENHWQSGYGMPSFTLLGSRVIRLPFIPHTSYPHEVLHNWWGNGVYIDASQGNWAEGLTSYLADHLLAERAGRGVDYRRDALQRYADFVRDEEEYPLRMFRGNHGEVSQAIGYGKAMMLFHMLRGRHGDEVFFQAIRDFYQNYLHQAANWSDLRRAMEKATGRNLEAEFSQWIDRVGAPELAVEGRLDADDGVFVVSGRIRQVQSGTPYRLHVPIAILFGEEEAPHVEWLYMAEAERGFRFSVKHPPVGLIVDPEFDLFRRLDPGEMPLSFSKLFGAANPRILLPAEAAPDRLTAYRELAQRWASSGSLEVSLDSEYGQLPLDRPLWVFGRENRFAEHLLADRDGVGQDDGYAAIAMLEGQIAGFVSARAEDLASVGRKLPHYGKYGRLRFATGSVENTLKERGPTGKSALALSFD